MGKSLVIVESPAKAKTINKFLGRNFTVKASMGHVRDLPKKSLGVDEKHDFKPTYEILPGRKKVIDELKKAAETADKVYLAPDPDREGEAICWHLAEILKKTNKNLHRVMFNEITKRAVQQGMNDPQKIDSNKVDAQQARRILDRLVGYKVSPLLWDKVRRGLSAGRVQSVALRIVVEREREVLSTGPSAPFSRPRSRRPSRRGCSRSATRRRISRHRPTPTPPSRRFGTPSSRSGRSSRRKRRRTRSRRSSPASCSRTRPASSASPCARP